MLRRHDNTRIAARARAGPLLVLGGALALLLGACEPYVEGNGVWREETRDVGASFVGLAVEDGIQATVTAGAPAQEVKVSGDENLLDYVETVVKDRAGFGAVLEVRVTSTYDSKNPLKVTVAVPVIAYVAAADASPVTVAEASAPLFTVDARDGSNVVLSGPGGEELELVLAGGQRGGAHIDARSYPVDEARVALTSGSRAEVRAAISVEGTAAGGSRLENLGAGACDVAASEGSVVACGPP